MLDIRGLFSKEAIVRYLRALPVIETPIMDTVFTNRPQLGMPMVGADLVKATARAVPAVRRGAPSISATGESGSINFYEPLPVRLNSLVTGQDLNNLRALGQASRQSWAQQKTDLLRRSVRKTTEALCAVSLSGNFSWPVQLEGGGFETWEVDFGSPESVIPDVLWDADTAKLKDVFALLQTMEEALEENGYGGTLEIWAGKSAYEQLFALAEASKTTAKIRVELTDQGINIGGYLVKRRAEKYYKPDSQAMTPCVAEKDLMMIAQDAGHMLPYCAVDDLEAQLQPLPFFVKPIRVEDPSGYKLVAESKPFPIPNVEGICTATVLS